MRVEFLARDELIVELELRGLIDSSIPLEITDSLKQALNERLEVEKVKTYKVPQDQHEAAMKHPLQEVAICQEKLEAVRHYLIRSAMWCDPLDEFLPRVYTKMLHVQGRMYRASTCDVFGERSEKLYEARESLWEVVILLEEGRVSPDDICDQLHTIQIVDDTPRVVQEEADEVEFEDDEEKEPKEDPMLSLDDETVEVKSEQYSEEVENTEINEVQIEEDKLGISEAEVEVKKIEEEAGEEQEEEQVVSLDNEAEVVEKSKDYNDETEVVEGDEDSEEVKEVKIEDIEVKSEDEVEGVIEDGIGYPEKECPVVSAKLTTQTAGNSSSSARDSHKRWQQDESASFRSKKPRCVRFITEFCAWIKENAVRVQIPIDRLLGVVDLRLEDEVLAKANRRVFREDVSGFSFVE